MPKSSITVEVRSNKLPYLRGRVRRDVGAAVRETTFAIQARAQANIVANGQVDTGAMLNSTQGAMDDDLHGVVRVGVDYGPHQEFGTVKMPARPFLTPAAEAERQPFIRRVTGILR